MLKGPGLVRRDIFVMYYPRPCRLNGQRRRGSGRLLEGSRAAKTALAFALWHVTQRLEERAVLAVFDVAPQGVDHLGADIGRGGVALLALFDGRFELAPARTGAAGNEEDGLNPDAVQRTPHPAPAAVQDVGVDHGRRHVLVAQELLYRSDVIAGSQEMGREAMAQRVTTCGLRNAGFPDGLFDRPPEGLLVEVMAAH